jgi:hypothetical protein
VYPTVKSSSGQSQRRVCLSAIVFPSSNTGRRGLEAYWIEEVRRKVLDRRRPCSQPSHGIIKISYITAYDIRRALPVEHLPLRILRCALTVRSAWRRIASLILIAQNANRLVQLDRRSTLTWQAGLLVNNTDSAAPSCLVVVRYRLMIRICDPVSRFRSNE